MNEATVTVQRREGTGKNAARRLRAAGIVPAVVYGAGREPVPIQVDRKRLTELIKESGGSNAVFLLHLEGTESKRHTMIRELDVDPISRRIRHVDFLRVSLDRKVRVQVSVELVGGVPYGVKNETGLLDFVTREVTVECLPGDIPPSLKLDVSALHVGQHLEAKDIELPPSVVLHDEPVRVIVSVSTLRVAATEAEAAEAATLLEAEVAEPEVIGRGKSPEEAEEE